MKRISTFLLALCLLSAGLLSFTACDENDAAEIFANMNEEEWAEALDESNFTNVTMYYTLVCTEGDEQGIQKHVVKATETEVYRHMAMYPVGADIEKAEPALSQGLLFEGDEAKLQSAMFLDVFFELVSDRDNFVYDEKAKNYKAPEDIFSRVETGSEGSYATELMEDAVITFDKYGRPASFTCTLTESAYSANDTLFHTVKGELSWTFADYNKTTITDEEREGAEKIGDENEKVEVSTGEHLEEAMPDPEEEN